MDKRDYLVKTFSRTKRKDYENYILTAIWHKLNNMELKPVSQQYVKRQNGTHALMDLYFPQLRIGIEVDEAHHKENEKEDKLRMDDIVSAVSEESINDFECLRIDATMTIEDINKRIDEMVTFIEERAAKTDLVWKTYEEELAELKNKDYLSIYDDIPFRYIVDITNTVFGKTHKGYQQVFVKMSDKTRLWCPKLSIIVDGEVKSVAAGWLNILAKDWSYIDESNEDKDTVTKRSTQYLEEMEAGLERVVFAKYKDNLGFNRYQFVGVFKSIGISPDNEKYVRYERIDDKVRIVE